MARKYNTDAVPTSTFPWWIVGALGVIALIGVIWWVVTYDRRGEVATVPPATPITATTEAPSTPPVRGTTIVPESGGTTVVVIPGARDNASGSENVTGAVPGRTEPLPGRTEPQVGEPATVSKPETNRPETARQPEVPPVSDENVTPETPEVARESPAPTSDREAVEPGPETILLRNIAQNPTRYYGQTVTVVGQLYNLLGAEAFAVGTGKDDILIAGKKSTFSDTPLNRGDSVRITGTVQAFNLAKFKQMSGASLSYLPRNWNERPAIFVTRMSRIPNQAPPKYSPDGILPTGPIVYSPSEYIGKRVTVSGKIVERISDRQFLLNNRMNTERPLTIMTQQPFEVGQMVTATGIVRYDKNMRPVLQNATVKAAK